MTSEPQQYRRRPVAVEAMQYTVESCRTIHDWFGLPHEDHDEDCGSGFGVDTGNDWFEVSLGDWVVQDADGGIAVFSPDTFALDYEAVPATGSVVLTADEGAQVREALCEGRHCAAIGSTDLLLGSRKVDRIDRAIDLLDRKDGAA